MHAQVTLHLPANVLQQRVNAFGQQLQTTLNALAQKRHVILLVQEAVVAGTEDVTPLVKQQLFQSNPQK